MSLGICLRRTIASEEAPFQGEALAEEQPALAAIARALRVVPLSEFTSANEEQMEALHEAGLPADRRRVQESWFEPSQGLRTVQALLAHLRDNTGDVANAEQVLAELAACERILMQAQDRSWAFHFTAEV